MFFKDIIGQEDTVRKLVHSVQNGQIAHAQLISGPEGIGKYAMALAYARYIQCTDRGETEACGKCPSCLKYRTLMHPDLHFVFPIVRNEKKKKRICDDYLPEWRSFLTENSYFDIHQWLYHIGCDNGQAIIYGEESQEIIRKMSMKTYESEYKVMIIWLPERMNQTCANKLLKMLEEPYDKTVFLLVSDRPADVLGTIRSRSQQIAMHTISPEAISQTLVEKYALEPQDAISVAHIANGNFVKALETIRLTEDNQQQFDHFVQLMRLAYGRKIKELKIWSEEMASLGREKQRMFFSYTQRMVRENYIYNLSIPTLNYMNNQEDQFSSRFAPFINERNVMLLIEELDRADRDIERNANAKILFFDFAVKMIMLLKK